MLQELPEQLERETTRDTQSVLTSEMSDAIAAEQVEADFTQPARPSTPTPDDDGELQSSQSTWNLLADQLVPARGQAPTWPDDVEFEATEYRSAYNEDEWDEYESDPERLHDQLQRVDATKALKKKCSKTTLIEFEFDNTLLDWEVALLEDEYDQLPDHVEPSLRRRGSSIVHEHDPHYRHKIKYDLKKTKMLMSTIAPAVVWRPHHDQITTLQYGDNFMKRVRQVESNYPWNARHRRDMIWEGRLGAHPLRQAVSVSDFAAEMPKPVSAPTTASPSTTWRPVTPWTLSTNWADDEETEEEQARWNAAASAKVSSADLTDLLHGDDGVRPGSLLAKAIDAERNATTQSVSSPSSSPASNTDEPPAQDSDTSQSAPAFPILVAGPWSSSSDSFVSSSSHRSDLDKSVADGSMLQVDVSFPLQRFLDSPYADSSLVTPRQSQSSLLAAVLAASDVDTDGSPKALSSQQLTDTSSAAEGPSSSPTAQSKIQSVAPSTMASVSDVSEEDASAAGCMPALKTVTKAIRRSLKAAAGRLSRLAPPKPKNKLRRKRVYAAMTQC